MQTKYKNTRGKVQSIYPSLVWHDAEKKKKKEKRKKKEVSTSAFFRKRILLALPGIAAQQTMTRIDPVIKTIYGKIKIGLTNNIYDKLFNNDNTKPTIQDIMHGYSIQQQVNITQTTKRLCKTKRRSNPVQVSR